MENKAGVWKRKKKRKKKKKRREEKKPSQWPHCRPQIRPRPTRLLSIFGRQVYIGEMKWNEGLGVRGKKRGKKKKKPRSISQTGSWNREFFFFFFLIWTSLRLYLLSPVSQTFPALFSYFFCCWFVLPYTCVHTNYFTCSWILVKPAAGPATPGWSTELLNVFVKYAGNLWWTFRHTNKFVNCRKSISGRTHAWKKKTINF